MSSSNKCIIPASLLDLFDVEIVSGKLKGVIVSNPVTPSLIDPFPIPSVEAEELRRAFVSARQSIQTEMFRAPGLTPQQVAYNMINSRIAPEPERLVRAIGHEYEPLKNKMSYPVGEYITKNLPLINHMYDALVKFMPEVLNLPVNLICTGSSGAIIAAILAERLSREITCDSVSIVHIKKKGERSHSGDHIRIYRNAIKIVVDDHVDTGATMRYIANKIADQQGSVHIDCVLVTNVVHLRELSNIFFGRLRNVISGHCVKHD